jgi:hypothetical protein
MFNLQTHIKEHILFVSCGSPVRSAVYMDNINFIPSTQHHFQQMELLPRTTPTPENTLVLTEIK